MLTLLEQHRPLALAIARDYHWEGADRDDVRQEAMIALHRAASSWQRRGSFANFAGGVIRRHLIDCLRVARGRFGHSKPVLVGVEPDVLEHFGGSYTIDDRLDAREELRRVLERWPSLSPRQSEMLARQVRGETYPEITAATGVPKKTAAAHVYRARHKLAA